MLSLNLRIFPLNFVALFVCCLLGLYVRAQSDVSERYAGRIMKEGKQAILVLEYPRDISEKKIVEKKPELEALYQQTFDSLTSLWIEAARKNWRLDMPISVMYPDSVILLKKGKSISQQDKIYLIFLNGLSSIVLDGIEAMEKQKLKSLDEVVAAGLYLSIRMYTLNALAEEGTLFGKSKDIVLSGPSFATYQFGSWCPSYTEMAFGINNIQSIVQLRAKDKKMKYGAWDFDEKDAQKLAKKTLLIPRSYLLEENKKDNVQESVIKKNYPYPYKIVDQLDIDRAVYNKQADYAVLTRTFWPGAKGPLQGLYFWVVDAADATTILSYSEPHNVNIGLGTVLKDQGQYALYERRVQKIVELVKGEK